MDFWQFYSYCVFVIFINSFVNIPKSHPWNQPRTQGFPSQGRKTLVGAGHVNLRFWGLIINSIRVG